MYDRKYLVIPVSEIRKVDFTKILETSPDHLVYSNNKKRTFIKWDGDDPEFVSYIKDAEGPYTNEEMLELLKSNKWETPNDDA